MPGTLYGEIHQQLSRHPSDICMVWYSSDGLVSHSIDCRTLLQQVDIYGNRINSNGFIKGSPVLIAAAPSPQIVAAIIAVMRIGGTAILPPAKANAATILRIIRQHSIKQLVVTKRPGIAFRLLAAILRLRIIVLSDVSISHISDQTSNNNDKIVWDGEGGLISHSSGSTGAPKTINRPSHILYAQHIALKKVFPPWPGQIDFPLFPNIILHNLACGVKSVVPHIPGFDITNMQPAKIILQIQQENIQTLTGNVFYCKQLLQHLQQHPQLLSQVQAIGIGGSPVPEDLIPSLQPWFPAAVFYIIYGSSEAEPIAVRKYTEQTFIPGDGYYVGEVYANLEIKINVIGNIILSNGKHQPVGEVVVRGPHVAVASPGDWMKTGDFGYLDDNQLWLTGRKGNEKIHDGVQHYQLEHCLVQMPLVENVAARADDDGFTIFVQGTATETSIKQTLYMQFKKIRINGIIFRNQLPLDKRHHSKIRYELLN